MLGCLIVIIAIILKPQLFINEKNYITAYFPALHTICIG